MKKILLCLVFITSIAQLSNAQTGISAAGTAPDASAMLDVIATDKGMLVPRVLLTATNTAGPIATPATGLLVYNTNTAGVAPNNVIPGFYYNSGTTVAPNWVRIISGNGSSNDAIMNQSAAVQNPGTFWIQGVGRVGDGTAAAPGLSFNSSANTGVFLPAATQLGLSTAGAERMRVDANGNVGIGTTGPESIFHIEKNASGAMGGDLVLTNKVSATNTAVAIDFGVDNSTTANGAGNAQIKVINMDGTNQKSDMTFSTWNGSAFGERMRIASNGNIGIGSATPAYKLDVVGDTKTSGKFFGHLNVDDTRAANTAPTGYNNEVAFDFKQISVLNSAPGSGTYGGLITMAPWGDNSGDASHQLLFNEGGIYWRQGQPDAAAWDAWSQVLTTSAGGAGTPNYLARWITANSLGIGATQDDGTNVGIGTAPATYKLSVAGNARFTNGAGSYVYVGSGGGAYYADAANTVVHTPAGGSFYMANVGTDGTKVAQSDGTLRVGGPSQGSANLYVYGSAGIGNTGPAEKLDVTGNIKATGVVYWGNGLTRTETRDDAGSQGGRSGFYETSVPAPAANWYTGASSWQHLMETRHSNTGNNYAMQIAGGFFDQDFWVRKTNNSATTAWSKMLTTANIGTSAIQNQYASAQTASFWVNGNAQIGSSFTNLNGRLLTSNQGGWQADGVTPQMVISANSASTNRAALIGLDLHNDNTTNNVYAPFITFSRRSNGTAYNSAFASIGAQVTGQGTDANWCAGDLIFSTENGTVNGMGERMRIDKSGRVYILQNQGNDPNFAGLDDPTSANGRAQLVLSSSYSDLVIASSEGNDNHGSTLTFASYNPANAADYRKFVINQGNWGARFGYLDFGFADAGGRTNPHSNINGTDNVITLNGINKRLGVGIMSPAQTLDVNGKARIRRGVNTMGGNANEGQLEIANTGSGDAYISFHREGAWGAQFGLESDNWFTTNGWSPGGGAWNSMRLGNLDIRGVVNCISGYCPSNNAIRMTPNLHLNNPAGNAVIINWDNGAVGGGTQQFRVGNGTGTDQFYVRADGQFYGRYFADLDDAGYYINPNGFSQTSSVYANNWFRAQNTSGFYFETYGGGWQMTDGTWIRAYNSKPILGTGGIAGYGNAVFGTPFNGSPRIYANYDNVNSGGIAISDDGGFYDFNDGWIQSRFSNGQDMRSNNTSWNTIFTMGNQDNSGLNDKLVASRNDNWGLMGGSGQAWWRGYSYGWVTSSMREKKRDITPIEGDLAALVMADIDKLKPSFYKYNAETDEYNETMPFKYRPNLHIGLILDESPDYLQDEQFSGIDNYSAATLGLLGAKVNHEEIKKLKKNVQDFGSVSVTSTTISVEFSEEFAQAISGSSLPVVTVNANVEGVIANIVEKSTTGFKVKVNKVEPGLMLDYIAMGKVLEKENIAELESKIPQEIYKGMRVDESIKQEQYKRAEQRKNDQENLEKQAGIDGERIHQERLKEIGVQVGDPAKEGAITSTISNLKTVGTDVDALIKEAQKQAEKNAPLYSPNKDEIPK